MIKKFNSIFVTIFSLGKIGFIPGTFGSLVTVLFLFVCFHILNISSNIILIILIIAFAYSFIAIKNYTENNENKDPGEIIIDEFIGQVITAMFLEYNFLNLLLAFVLFRFFDIVKIFPADYIDKNYSGCFGIVLDDIVAALQAASVILFINVYII